MDWFYEFPEMGSSALRALKKSIDGSFRDFTREHGELMEQIFDPLKQFLIFSEQLLTDTPWPIVIAVIAGLAWFASRSLKIAIGTVITLLLIGYFGMWEDTMRTVSMIFVCTITAIVLGLPIGVLMSRFDGMQRIVNPTLDIMQTMPSFVYLIPVVMLLGIGKVPGLIAVVIYAIPPIIRFTNLGIRLVPADVLEASEAFGTSAWQKNDEGAIAVGVANHHGGCEPDHHVVIGDGGDCIHDRCARFGSAGIEGDCQSVLHAGYV